jgi:hypothetical protein
VNTGVFAFLTFDLEAEGQIARAAVSSGIRLALRRRFDFLGDVRDGPRAQPVSLAMSWSVAGAAEVMALSHVTRRMPGVSPWPRCPGWVAATQRGRRRTRRRGAGVRLRRRRRRR